MQGNWRDCRNCRRSFMRLTSHGDKGASATDVGAHGLRESRRVIDASGKVGSSSIEDAFARLHAAAPEGIPGEVIQREIRAYFERESAALRGEIRNEFAGVLKDARDRLSETVAGEIRLFMQSQSITRLITNAVVEEARRWLQSNIRQIVDVRVTANVVPPPQPATANVVAAAVRQLPAGPPTPRALPAPGADPPSPAPRRGLLEID